MQPLPVLDELDAETDDDTVATVVDAELVATVVDDPVATDELPVTAVVDVPVWADDDEALDVLPPVEELPPDGPKRSLVSAAHAEKTSALATTTGAMRPGLPRGGKEAFTTRSTYARRGGTTRGRPAPGVTFG